MLCAEAKSEAISELSSKKILKSSSILIRLIGSDGSNASSTKTLSLFGKYNTGVTRWHQPTKEAEERKRKTENKLEFMKDDQNKDIKGPETPNTNRVPPAKGIPLQQHILYKKCDESHLHESLFIDDISRG